MSDLKNLSIRVYIESSNEVSVWVEVITSSVLNIMMLFKVDLVS